MDALNGKNAEIVYGCEDPLIIPATGTIGEAWRENAGSLGADPDRPVSFRCGGKLVSSSAGLVAGNTYEATVTHGSKGA